MMRLAVFLLCGGLLALSSCERCSEDSADVATWVKLNPLGQCEDENSCTYQVIIPPLSIQLPRAFKAMDDMVKELQDLKEEVNKLRRDCKNQQITKATGWTDLLLENEERLGTITRNVSITDQTLKDDHASPSEAEEPAKGIVKRLHSHQRWTIDPQSDADRSFGDQKSEVNRKVELFHPSLEETPDDVLVKKAPSLSAEKTEKEVESKQGLPAENLKLASNGKQQPTVFRYGSSNNSSTIWTMRRRKIQNLPVNKSEGNLKRTSASISTRDMTHQEGGPPKPKIDLKRPGTSVNTNERLQIPDLVRKTNPQVRRTFDVESRKIDLSPETEGKDTRTRATSRRIGTTTGLLRAVEDHIKPETSGLGTEREQDMKDETTGGEERSRKHKNTEFSKVPTHRLAETTGDLSPIVSHRSDFSVTGTPEQQSFLEDDNKYGVQNASLVNLSNVPKITDNVDFSSNGRQLGKKTYLSPKRGNSSSSEAQLYAKKEPDVRQDQASVVVKTSIGNYANLEISNPKNHTTSNVNKIRGANNSASLIAESAKTISSNDKITQPGKTLARTSLEQTMKNTTRMMPEPRKPSRVHTILIQPRGSKVQPKIMDKLSPVKSPVGGRDISVGEPKGLVDHNYKFRFNTKTPSSPEVKDHEGLKKAPTYILKSRVSPTHQPKTTILETNHAGNAQNSTNVARFVNDSASTLKRVQHVGKTKDLELIRINTDRESIGGLYNPTSPDTAQGHSREVVEIPVVLETLANAEEMYNSRVLAEGLDDDNDELIQHKQEERINQSTRLTDPASRTEPDTDTGREHCADHVTQTHRNGVYRVTAGQRSGAFPVFCDMESSGGGWTVIQRRINGDVTFNRTWDEYKRGFGRFTGDFWLGNDKIHTLTKAENMSLRIELEDLQGTREYADYRWFYVANESQHYRLSIGGYSGTAGDAMQFSEDFNHDQQLFTTPDRDNDRYPSGNCGAYYGSGWWFGSCMSANLNGKYYLTKYKGVRNGIFWGTWHNITKEYYPTHARQAFKRVRMMIRPASYRH